jgi:TatD DNase family protein
MHCHLDRYRDPAKVASEAAKAGVNIIAVTNLPSHFQQGRTPVAALKNVRLSLGLHPLLAPHSASEKALFVQLASATSYIGEVGLDFSKEGVATKAAQIESFEHVLEVIEKQGKVISIHSRGAEEAVLQRLKLGRIETAVFHWFSGPESTLIQVVDTGHYVSVNGAMLDSKRMKPLIASLPKSCLLLETDGPYTKTGSTPARPAHLRQVIAELAVLWNCSSSDVELQLATNFRTLLSRLEADKAFKGDPA